jgi:small subunit ribosomal protein S4
MYGILEKQFRIYVEKALKSKGNTGEALLVLLEKRLDNVVYRLGLATNRIMARQLVSHRHVLVNGTKVNIPSYQTKVGDVITLTEKISKSSNISKVLANSDYNLPSWLSRQGNIGNVKSEPKRDDIVEPVSEQDIVEFYSR